MYHTQEIGRHTGGRDHVEVDEDAQLVMNVPKIQNRQVNGNPNQVRA